MAADESEPATIFRTWSRRPLGCRAIGELMDAVWLMEQEVLMMSPTHIARILVDFLFIYRTVWCRKFLQVELITLSYS